MRIAFGYGFCKNDSLYLLPPAAVGSADCATDTVKPHRPDRDRAAAAHRLPFTSIEDCSSDRDGGEASGGTELRVEGDGEDEGTSGSEEEFLLLPEGEGGLLTLSSAGSPVCAFALAPWLLVRLLNCQAS